MMEWKTVKKWFVVVGIILLSLGEFGKASFAEGSSLHTDKPFFDFGEVEEGITVTHTFRVKNLGNTPLHIKDVRPG